MHRFTYARASLRAAVGARAFCALTLVVAQALAASPARGIPAFARQYRTGCGTCHRHFPELNEFGRAFLLNNLRIPGRESDSGLAWTRGVPLDIALAASTRYDPAERRSTRSDLDAIILLGGGLLSARDSFFLHHHLQEEHRPGDLYEGWVQHSFPGRGNISLRLGQFEQPLGLSPEILRLAHPGYLIYEATVGLNDYALSSPVRGILLAGGSLGDGLRFALSVGSARAAEEAHGEHEERHEEHGGESTAERPFGEVFARVQRQAQEDRFGLFGSLGRTKLTTLEGKSTDRYSRVGVDAEIARGHWRLYGLWVEGTDTDPAGEGERGGLSGGFVGLRWSPNSGAQRHSGRGGRYSLYLQYDRARARGAGSAGTIERPLAGVLYHPTDNWSLHLEFQRVTGSGRSVVLATHLAL